MLLDRVAGTVGLAGNVRQSIQKARLLEGRLEELSDLEDEEERDRIQALCDSVGTDNLVIFTVLLILTTS